METKFLLKVCAVAFLGGLVLVGSCAHSSLTLDECVALRLSAYVPAQAKQAHACNKDVDCLVAVGLAAAVETKNDIDICEASSVTTSPVVAQPPAPALLPPADGGTVLYFNGPAQEI